MNGEAAFRRYADFDAILNSIYCAIFIVHTNGRAVYRNGAADELKAELGVTEDELIGALEAQIDIVHGQGRFAVAVEGGMIICHLLPWTQAGQRQGSIIVAHISGKERCSAQELDNVIDVLEEIDAILEVVADGIVVADKNGVIIRVNKALETTLGIKRRDVLGRSMEIFDREHSVCGELIRKMNEDPKRIVVSGTYKQKELLCTGAPIFDRQHRLKTIVISIQDMSALNTLRKKLEEQRLYTKSYMREISLFNGSGGPIVAHSPAMRKILHLVHVVADVESVVLITGESGTGKEVVVNEIYHTSRRKDKPFIKINCGAIPDTLFESELFGYESGAFTGARRQGKVGFFELANKGTLLLDEVGELSLAAQVKLLRVIQEKEVQRIGAAKPVKVDVRLIAATNKDLWSMVCQGTFRQDLYYRLNVIHIHIPPLRERREDIIPLVNYFLKYFNEKYGKEKEISPELYRFLMRQDWPGNIRELENAVETMIVLPSENKLMPSHFVGKGTGEDSGAAVKVQRLVPWKRAVEEMEKELLTQAYREYRSTRAMAKALQIDQSTVVRKMKKWGVGSHEDDKNDAT